MHATFVVCAMMVGGYVTPEPEITTVPLHENFSIANNIQDRELKEATRNIPLPKVPTLGEHAPQGDSGPMPRGYRPTNPQSNPTRPVPQQLLPNSPTAGGDMGTGGRPMPQPPTLPQSGNTGGAPLGPGSSDPYANRTTPGYNPLGPGVQANQIQRSQVADRASNYTNQNSIANYNSRYNNGVTQNPFTSGSNAAANSGKAFDNIAPPSTSGVSPWQNLYGNNSSNSNLNPYYNSVRPALQQQNFNQRVSEQIGGVQGMGQRTTGNGTPGIEQPVNGAGLANPNYFINYGNYYPQNH